MRTFNEPSDSPRDPVLNIDQVCSVLAVSRPTLMMMIEEGNAPPFFKIGRRRKITLSALRAWIERRQRLAIQDQAA
jgi:excisionase family DNA binding protein